ncbi:unnamed protein product [Caenorhabditis brenneri]
MPFSETVPDLSKLISQIRGSQGLLNNGHPIFPATQSIGVHHDYQDSLSEFNAAHYTNNPILNVTVPDLFSLLTQIQDSQGLLNNKNPAHLTPQPVDMHHQDILNFHPTEPNNNPRLNSASNGAMFSDHNLLSTHLLVQNMLNASSPTSPTNLAAQIDFSTLLAGLWGPLTRKIMKHVNHPTHEGNAAEALNYILDSAFNDAFLRDLLANNALSAHNAAASSTQLSTPPISQLMSFSNNIESAKTSHQHTACSTSSLKRHAPTTHSQSSSSLQTVTIGAPPLPPFAKRPRQDKKSTPTSSSNRTVASLYGLRQSSFLKESLDFSQQFLAQNPSGEIDISDIKCFMDPPEDEEEEIEDVQASYTPITDGLKGLEAWTPETAEGYGRSVTRYIEKRTRITAKVKKLTPRVLSTEERQAKHVEAEEYVRNCPLYKDPMQSIRTSLFNPTNPAIPQKVKHTLGSNRLFEAYQNANPGIEPKRTWKEVKEERGEEFYRWTKVASDLRDEHLRQSELGYVIFREISARPKKRRVDGPKNMEDHRKDSVAGEGSIEDEESDSEIVDVVG